MTLLPNQGPALPLYLKNSGAPKPPTPPSTKRPVTEPRGITGTQPPSKPMSALDKWLAGDTTYQQQVAELNAERQAAQQNRTRLDQITNRNFASTERQMNTQAAQDRQDQQYDFAGRGILHSGVYAKALGNYNTDFQTKLNNLIQGKTDALGQSQSDLNDLLRQINIQQNAAKQDAIRRRQQQLGL